MIFGHQSDARQSSNAVPAPDPAQTTDQAAPTTNPLAADSSTGAPLPVVEADTPHPFDAPEESVLNQPNAPGYSNDPAPTTPFGNDQATQPDPQAPPTATPDPVPTPAPVDPQPMQSYNDFAAANTPAPTPTVSDPTPTPDPIPEPASVANVDAPVSNSGDLLSLKQQALDQLGPLVSHLDQSPEEKFRTTMMLIQSTDNSALLKDAYEAAQAIPDDKVRAQALLDVVNEINYFTQQSDSNQAA